jgi:enoyl-CoA hydratase/carnithine racemase
VTVLDFTPPTYEAFVLEVIDDDVLLLTINRPERMNSMTKTFLYELSAIPIVVRDLPARALILTAAGDRAFSAGFDLDEIHMLSEIGDREYFHFQELAAGAMVALRALPFPVIAAVNGAAAGGGLGLALAADIRIASTTAKFNAAFVRVGMSSGELGTTWLLTRLIGPGRAAEMAFTARNVGAEEAVRIGLANSIVEPEDLLDAARALARRISANSPSGVRMSKRALQFNQEITSYAAAMELENRGQTLLTRTADMPEALAAFREKRTPVFTGE